eukprot:SAG25_NODE_411_length_8395_cov_6.454556_10_plen_96_part_00
MITSPPPPTPPRARTGRADGRALRPLVALPALRRLPPRDLRRLLPLSARNPHGLVHGDGQCHPRRFIIRAATGPKASCLALTEKPASGLIVIRTD